MSWRTFKFLDNAYSLALLDYGVTAAPRAHEDLSTWTLDWCAVSLGMDMAALRAAACQAPCTAFAVEAFGLIDGAFGLAQREVEQPNVRLPHASTPKKWRRHLQSLEQMGLIERVHWTRAKSCSRYFAVAKDNEQRLCRSIFSGAAISALMEAPTPVGLPSINEILEKSRETVRRGPVTIVNGDFRHFFHQIKMPTTTSEYLGLRSGGKTWLWRGLPMGISHAPSIAQRLGWLAILYREFNEADWPFVLSRDTVLQTTPRMLELRGGGFVFLYYDNFFAIGNDHAVVQRLHDTMIRNTTKFNIKWKFVDIYSPKRLRTTNVEILGVELRVIRRRGRDDNWEYDLTWRLPEAKINTWLAEAPGFLTGPADPESHTTTCREVASVIGRCMRYHIVRLSERSAIGGLVRLLRRLAAAKDEALTLLLKPRTTETTPRPTPTRHEMREAWDAQIVLTSTETAELRGWWAEIAANPWLATDWDPVQVVWACSDSSDDGWGFCTLTEAGCDVERAFRWAKGMAEQHIYVKELFAAIYSTMSILRTCSEKTTIHMGVDNSAAAAALRNGISCNAWLSEQLDVMYAELKRKSCRVNIVDLRSEDNASDAPSRGLHCSRTRFLRCWRAMQLSIAGLRTGPSVRRPAFNGGVRKEQADVEPEIELLESLSSEQTTTEWEVDKVHDKDATNLLPSYEAILQSGV